MVTSSQCTLDAGCKNQAFNPGKSSSDIID